VELKGGKDFKCNHAISIDFLGVILNAIMQSALTSLGCTSLSGLFVINTHTHAILTEAVF